MAGDITAAMPYRAMINIIDFIQAMDQVVPGFAAIETLLYSPGAEVLLQQGQDGRGPQHQRARACTAWATRSGWTRGLMMASVMGVLMGRKLA